MRFPLSMTTSMIGYIARKKRLTGARSGFPAGAHVGTAARLQLDLHRLAAVSANIRIDHQAETRLAAAQRVRRSLRRRVPSARYRVDLRRRADDHPDLGRLVKEASCSAARHIILCTNGMFIKNACTSSSRPTRFFFSTSISMWPGGDASIGQRRAAKRVFKAAIDGIMAAKKAGFLVTTNTTIYKDTDLAEIDAAVHLSDASRRRWSSCCRLGLRLQGGLQETNPDRAAEISPDACDDSSRAKFREAEKLLKKHRMNNSPVYLEFLSRQAGIVLHRRARLRRAQYQGLEGPVLSHHRRAPRDPSAS